MRLRTVNSNDTSAGLREEERQDMPATSTATSIGAISSGNSECDGVHDTKSSPRRDLHSLLDINIQRKEDREKFDGKAIIMEVKRNPEAAEHEYVFSCNRRESTYPLHQAVKLGASLDVVEAIYNSYPQAVTKKESRSGNTALYLACTKQSSPDVLSFLLEKWPQAAREKNRHGVSPLHVACAHQVDVDVVSQLLVVYPEGIKEQFNGKTPLMLTLIVSWKKSLSDLVPVLLDRWPGAARVKDSKGYTPLHVACAQDAPLETVVLLLEKWPEAVMEKNDNDQTPSSIARGKSASKHIQDILWYMSYILEDGVDKVTLREAVETFAHMGWWGGVALVLKMHQTFASSLNLDIRLMPRLLDFVGRRGNMTTLSNMIANRHDLITEA